MKRSAVKGRAVSLTRKLIGAFILVALLVGLTSGLAYFFLHKMDTSYSLIINDNVRVLTLASDIQVSTQSQSRLLFDYLLAPSNDKANKLKAANSDLSGIISKLAEFSDQEDNQMAITALGDSNVTFGRLVAKIIDYMDRDQPQLAKQEADLWSVPLTATLSQAAEEIREHEAVIMEQEKNQNKKRVSAILRLLVFVSILALVASSAIGVLLSRFIVRPIKNMVKATTQIAACDLTATDLQVRNRDELRDLAESFNQMKANLHMVICQVGTYSDQVAASAEQLSMSSEQAGESSRQIAMVVQEIAAGTDGQAQHTRQCGEATEELSSFVLRISEAVDSMSLKSSQALQETQEGEHAINVAYAQNSAIHDKISQLADSVERLGNHSNRIGTAIDSIAQIAKQTQILALNASIEAARSGEAGKGFAVIAEEVRKLSLQTGKTVLEVTAMIGAIRMETASVVQTTEEGFQEVRLGMEVVHKAGEAFQRIRSSNEEVSYQVEQVSGQITQMASQAETIKHSVFSIDQVAEHTAGGTQDVSAYTEEQLAGMQEMVVAAAGLSTMADELQQLISRFKV